MASATKVLETIRKRKRDKHLKTRTNRVRRALAKIAKETPAELQKFVPGHLAK